MPQGQGLAKKSFGSAPIAGGQPGPLGESQLDVNTGFVLFNQGADAAVTGGVAFSAVSNSTTPVVTTSSIAASGISLQSGDVVRLSQPSGGADVNDLLGIDFQVNYTSDTSFTFANALQQAPGAAGVLPGTWRKVNVSSIFYPETRYIVNITQAAQAVVTTSVDHDYLAGQEVRFHIDTLKDLNKMVEIDNLIGTIVDTTDSTFTVDIDTRAFTPFLFPTIAQAQAIASNYTPAYVGPVGGNTAYSVANNLDSLTDAEVNI